jgi:predicted phosphate transport protein (TIGR00153 family)
VVEMRNIESWLKTRRKVKAVALVGEQSKDAVMAMEQLQRCISYAIEGRREGMMRSYAVLRQKEKEADALKMKITYELAKGDLPSSEREDLLRLAKGNGQVIDWINETARILVELELENLPEDIRGIAYEMSQALGECVSKLDDCMGKMIEKRFPEALAAADEVEASEERIDGIYQRARKAINALGDEVQVGPAVLLCQFMDALENIADRCEDSCDEVRVISVTKTQ